MVDNQSICFLDHALQPLNTFFFFNDTATTEIYTLSLHDALPIFSATSRTARTTSSASTTCATTWCSRWSSASSGVTPTPSSRSEEHTSELQSPCNLVCRLLLEKKNLTSILSTINRLKDVLTRLER